MHGLSEVTAEPIKPEDNEHLKDQDDRVGSAQIGLAGMGLWWHARSIDGEMGRWGDEEMRR
jgi:hypothetical protein